MPQPHGSDPQSGWQLAAGLLIAGAAGILGAVINQIGTWRVELIRRRNAADQRELDRDEAYTERISKELEQLTARFDNLVKENKEDALRTAERERKITQLETQLERLVAKVEILEAKKADYESEIIGLKQIIADRDAIIAELRKQLADALVIGVGEASPPARRGG